MASILEAEIECTDINWSFLISDELTSFDLQPIYFSAIILINIINFKWNLR